MMHERNDLEIAISLMAPDADVGCTLEVLAITAEFYRTLITVHEILL